MAASDSVEWEVFYHQAPFKGRGEFIRLMFRIAGVPFVEKGGDELAQLCGAFQPLDKISSMSNSHFAPPLIRHGSFVLSQTGAIMEYLGVEFDMAPTDPLDRALCSQLNWTIADCVNSCRAPFHAKDQAASYSTQIDEAAVAVKEFCKEGGRWDKILAHFANFIETRRAATGKPDGFLFGKGENISYGEVALYHMVDAMRNQFTAEKGFPYWSESCRANVVSVLESFLVTCQTIPNLKAYVDSDERKPWGTDSCA